MKYIHPFKTNIPSIQKFFDKQEVEHEKWRQVLWKFDNLFPERILRKIVSKIYAEMLTYAEKELDKCYIEYFELAKRNVPYEERVSKIDRGRIQFLEQQIIRINKQKATFKVRKLSQWLELGDDKEMRRIGSQRFIHKWFGLAVITK